MFSNFLFDISNIMLDISHKVFKDLDYGELQVWWRFVKRGMPVCGNNVSKDEDHLARLGSVGSIRRSMFKEKTLCRDIVMGCRERAPIFFHIDP